MNEDKKYDEYVEMMETLYPKMFANPYGGFAVGQGWWTLLNLLCHEIQTYIDHQNRRRDLLLRDNPHGVTIPLAVEQVTVAQIKEKFGGLRFYYDGGDDYIRGLATMAEVVADRTCEECGKPGHRRSGGWVRTLCDEHEAERQTRMRVQHE